MAFFLLHLTLYLYINIVTYCNITFTVNAIFKTTLTFNILDFERCNYINYFVSFIFCLKFKLSLFQIRSITNFHRTLFRVLNESHFDVLAICDFKLVDDK